MYIAKNDTHDAVAQPSQQSGSVASGSPSEQKEIFKFLGWSQVVARLGEFIHEIPDIVRGLWNLAKPFKWPMLAILALNVVIAVWETAIPFMLTVSVDAFKMNSKYIETVAMITATVMAIQFPQGIILPAVRELIAVRYLRPQFESEVGRRSEEYKQSQGKESSSELTETGGPVLEGGRSAAYALIDILLRDPAFALRGVVLLAALWFTSPVLVMILLLGMVLDAFITFHMDAKLLKLYASQLEHRFQMRGLENRILDQEINEKGRYQRSRDDFISATRSVETRRIFYQSFLRAPVGIAFQLVTMAVVAGWVYEGSVTVGEYIWFTQAATRAHDPLNVFFNLQNHVMTNRESLRRLGLLTGVDFGLKKPIVA